MCALACMTQWVHIRGSSGPWQGAVWLESMGKKRPCLKECKPGSIPPIQHFIRVNMFPEASELYRKGKQLESGVPLGKPQTFQSPAETYLLPAASSPGRKGLGFTFSFSSFPLSHTNIWICECIKKILTVVLCLTPPSNLLGNALKNSQCCLMSYSSPKSSLEILMSFAPLRILGLWPYLPSLTGSA